MKTVFFLVLILVSGKAIAQVVDQFSDGDFTNNPVWAGTTADYTVNTSNQLQLNNTIAATSYLSTAHGLSTLDGKEWNFWYSQTFSPSSSNFGRFYLTSSSADLSTNPDGFYLQFGEAGSTDAVRLFKCVSGTSTQICTSPDGQIAASFAVGVRVVRDNAGNWELYVDPSGGTNYGSPYSGIDATNLLGTHSGLLATYTISNADNYYFDNLYIGNEIFDTQAPSLVSATPISATSVDVLFSEPVAGSTILQNSNYILNPAIPVQSVSQDGSNLALMHLTLSSSLTNGQTYQLTVGSAQDPSGNTANALSTNFSYLVGEDAVPGDIIINEIMCDQTPVIGLPEVEFVEIYNKSSKYIDLTGWKLGDASSDGTIVSGFINPGQYKVLCSTSSQTFYPSALAVTSFPSLNNSGDDVVLKENDLTIINKVSYTDDWYNDEIKKDGGYTLELINPNDPCSDASNWSASNSVTGGTPEGQNSIYNVTPDTQTPTLIATNALAPNYLEVIFSEGMDSTTLSTTTLITNPSLTTSAIYIANTFSNTAVITFTQPLLASQTYTFTMSPVADCWLNQTSVSGHFALAEDPVAGDLIVNELLFDPGTGGTDFIEVYNNSSKVLNLKNIQVANFDDDTISNIHTIPDNYFMYPGEYAVLTADSIFQKNQFPAAVIGTFYEMALPALNNDSGTVYLMFNGAILDKVSYKEDWHLSMLDDTENKTLERIDPNGASSSGDNWHTAAEPIGFGTPGAQNSQYQNPQDGEGSFGTTELIFSPDNDGFQDVLIFYYAFGEPGLLATVTIYDDQGRIAKNLMKSELMGISGNFSWNGLNNDEIKSPIGVYLAVMELFSVDGSQKFVKRIAFTLGGKLN